ncbi:DNA-binding XRE family transcriptional regulator/quercetin dioxygenase-like cupin family protein [Crossiella equi]|uniref:DNA-binding XRE family transcriptional regulator/quercetin dioxygenase-like cupin family protein n=1 Tax=Crossiella equi TaxID=130796 RepID=A0ABS5A6P6_9PSEU|nr:XRE family transcriptional regulator [Crossiella equi]MBP2472226.1 DNA-binding XRE family transcriptional regulator/quercetin dioxygenase-like cupin family protein [Crossiella equi]
MPGDEGAVGPSEDLAAGIGAVIREARKRAGLTATELASATGLSQAFLSHLETGRSAPSIATLYRLAEALDLPPQDLLPRPPARDLVITRRGQGPRLPGAERVTAGGGFTPLAGGRGGLLTAHEVTAAPEAPAGDWFEHPGEDLVVVLEGTLEIQFRDWETERLHGGDSAWFRGAQPHRWLFPSGSATRLLLVTAHGGAEHGEGRP